MTPMMPMMLTLSLLLAAGCASSSKQPAQPAPQPVAAAEPPAASEAAPADPAAPPEGEMTPESEASGMEMLAFMGQIADIFDANQADCAKMGVELKQFADANKDKMAALKAAGDKFSPEQKHAFMQKHESEFQAVMSRMMTGAQACASDQGVKDAMQSFQAM
jgi:hypothetical protein